MEKLWIIGVGGGIGSIVRFLLSTYVQEKLNNATFPFGTIVVNIAGCLFIGMLSYLSDVKGVIGSDARAFLFIGLLGGFTTFSTFGNETVNLIRGGEYLQGMLNIACQLGIGIAAVIAGRILAQAIWR
ncbi:MAG: fluoride efflux transporter CrcB [Anaerolineales bacterium]|nr:fluoride efflux transporter CrcB [Anaerolineales bacterium]